MDSYNLKTASTYLNNLLLARGLLRDGKPIEFAHPSRGEGGKEVTMAQIINLVHDLILKRDRDQEHREAIAGTLRASRSETTRQNLALEKLQTRNEDLARQLSLAQSQERSARAALRTAESTARTLREDMVRLKTTVQQVRTSCANDIRKRDVQLQRLKSHLTSQQRGNKTGLVGASITINPGGMGLGGLGSSARDDGPDVEDAEYGLKQETTEFLTQLSQSLSDENDNLIGLVRTTITTLKELQGMPEGQREHDDEGLSTIGEEDETRQQSMMQALPTSYETLANDLDCVLDNLKNLLTNPNFVSVEEVELREEEILRLRAGWEKMELRLREAFALMETWRSRMANGGDTINLEELKMGLGLGIGLKTVHDEDISVITEEGEEQGSSVFEEELDDADNLPEPPSPEVKTAGADMYKLKLQSNPPALRESHGNTKAPMRSPRKVAFSASIPNTPAKSEKDAEASAIDLVGVHKPARATPQSREGPPAQVTPSSQEGTSRCPVKDDRTPRHVRCDDLADQIIKLASKVDVSSSPSFPSSPLTSTRHALAIRDSDDEPQERKRSSSPSAHPDEPSPKLTVQDKLKAAQAEAEAAVVPQGVTIRSTKAKATATEEDVEHTRRPRANSRGSPKKTRISGRPRKRRPSTLTPEELDKLLLTR